MANAIWPSQLPQVVQIRSYKEMPPRNTIRTAMDIGPPKSRRRSTSAPVPVEIVFTFTTEELAIFDDFYNTTLLNGSQLFDWKHPRTQVPKTFQFSDDPNYSLSGDHRDWTVTLPLLMLA